MHRLLKMRLDEFQNFLPLFILNLLMTSGFFVARTAKDALFYSHAGASRLPIAFIVNAVIIFFIGGWIARSQDRLPLKRMMHLSWLVTLLFAVAFGVIFGTHLTSRLGLSPYFAYFAFFEIPYLILTGLFWTFADGYFTERQADDIYPKITAGAHLGTTIAGLTAIFATPFIGVVGLIDVWCGILLVSLVVLTITWQRRPPHYTADPTTQDEPADIAERMPPSGGTIGSGFRAIFRHRYAKLFMMITFCTFFIMSVFDYSLADTSKAIFHGDVDKLTVYLGYVTTAFGVVAFFIQLLVIPRLTRRLGVANTNIIAPSLLTAGGLVLLASYTFAAAAVARGLFLVNEFVFNQTLLPFIYGAVPLQDRNQVRSTTEGTVTNIALGIAGLFLILPSAVPGFHAYWLGMAVFIAALVMLALSVSLRHEYNNIRSIRFEMGDSTGRMRYLDALAKLDVRELDLQLRRDLTSESEPNVLLALNFVEEHRNRALFNPVLALVAEENTNIRLSAIRSVGTLIDSEEDFDRFVQCARLPQGPSRYRPFRNEDVATIQGIIDIYLGAGRASQLGSDLSYLLDTGDSDPYVQSLVACSLIKNSGTVKSIQKGFEFLDAMLNSDDTSKNVVAAQIIGGLGYEADNFGILVNWVKSGVSPDLRRVALTSVITIGLENRTASEIAFRTVLESMDDCVLCNTANEGIGHLTAAYPRLVMGVRAFWESRESSHPEFTSLMGGVLPDVPRVLKDVPSLDADLLLLDMAERGEHQVARGGLDVLAMRLSGNHCLGMANLHESCLRMRKQFQERICLCGRLLADMTDHHGRSELVQNALSYRIEELFRQYCRTLWMSRRRPENASKLDRDIMLISSQDLLARDTALKSIEIELSDDRALYLELVDLVDALDYRKDMRERCIALSQLAAKNEYSWYQSDSSTLVSTLADIKKDAWLSWVLSEDRAKTDNTATSQLLSFEQALNILSETQPFAGVPAELLARLLLSSKSVESKSGDRILFEGQSQQGFVIITEGSTSILSENELHESPLSPIVLGHYDAISGQPGSAGVRAASTPTRWIHVAQADLDKWLSGSPQTTIMIAKSVVNEIEGLNTKEGELKAERSELRMFSEQIQTLQQSLQEVIGLPSGTKSQGTIVKRFLASSFDIDVSGLPSYIKVEHLEQFYLVVDKDREMRLQSRDNKTFYMTLKDRSRGESDEVTVSVDSTLYYDMRPLQAGRLLKKTRYSYESGPHARWSIDVYDKDSPFQGLIIGEIELSNPDSLIPEAPSYLHIRSDISELKEFENRNLALYGPPDYMFTGRWQA